MLILCVVFINLRAGGPLVPLFCRLRLYGTEEYVGLWGIKTIRGNSKT